MDVGSSRTAANVVGTVQGSLKSLVIDLAVLLEGHSTVSHHLALAFFAGLAHSALPCDNTWGERKSLVTPGLSHKSHLHFRQIAAVGAYIAVAPG